MDISRRLVLKYDHIKSAIILFMVALFSFSACSPSRKELVNKLNEKSYAFHYRNLDSTLYYAREALKYSSGYESGEAEALNNLAFVRIVYMDYPGAHKMLNSALAATDNQVELLISDILLMRLCQRESKNKDFYVYHERAETRLKRILEEAEDLDEHQQARLLYAKSELNIVTATYYYYVGLKKPFVDELQKINPIELQKDTAQYLNYLYNIGAGSVISEGTPEQIAQQEFDLLLRCYMGALNGGYPYWEANSLQSLSEHIQSNDIRDFLISENTQAFQFLNVYGKSEDLLAGNFAERALSLFKGYGDTYQISGSYRTLAQCYWSIKDYHSAIVCLESALSNKHIEKAPDLVASIREQLSITYSAIDDKQKSDYNRNIYLDLQELTRQDKQLEARADQLDSNTIQLNLMLVAVVIVILLLVALLFVFSKMRRTTDKKESGDKLLEPLREWKVRNDQYINELNERYEELNEDDEINKIHILKNKKRNLEQRAKVQLVNSVMPLIDRMVNEVNRLLSGKDSAEVKSRRYEYIIELTDKINDYNQILTQWIQMRQGQLSLHIESFAMQELFEFVKKGRMGFQLKDITLNVKDTEAVVKADKTLTLFMINTICDNSRKFTPEGGTISLSAEENENFVEIAIEDNGKGMDDEQLRHVFDRTYTGGHGFGLLNCKGIIEKYKKVSSLFNVCDIRAESSLGKGSKFTFRLPKGILRKAFMLLMLLLPCATSLQAKQHDTKELKMARQFSDSTYFCNINGEYERTLQYADSAIYYLNLAYRKLQPKGRFLMKDTGDQSDSAAEIGWFRDGVDLDYGIILSLRNECAVAALALHDWNRYHYNNNVYTQLYRESTADESLGIYVKTLQKTMNAKIVAIILLVLLLVMIYPAYYFLYYRHRVYYRICVEKINQINKVLLSDKSTEQKLEEINLLWTDQQKRSVRDSSLTKPLNKLVGEIVKALEDSINIYKERNDKIEFAEDELNKSKYEDGKLHISNSVLDNCLSTLKHETMYYPSRIRQLIDGTDANLESISELANYYKSLYAMLSLQCMRQVEGNVKYDHEILKYLFELLKKQTGYNNITIATSEVSPRYFHVNMLADNLQLSDDERKNLFTPFTRDVSFLLCRQIVREIGEVTNARGCGIVAELNAEGKNEIVIILPRVLENEVRNINIIS